VYSQLQNYAVSVDKFGGDKELNPSDRKKLLSMPFFLSKRTALPEPRPGQKEWALFEQIHGKPWDAYEGLSFDEEEKITEFNYEKFFPKHYLDNIDTQSEEFKMKIRELNFNSKTAYE